MLTTKRLFLILIFILISSAATVATLFLTKTSRESRIRAAGETCGIIPDCLIYKGNYCSCDDKNCCCNVGEGGKIEEFVCTRDKDVCHLKDPQNWQCKRQEGDLCTHYGMCGNQINTQKKTHQGPATVCIDKDPCSAQQIDVWTTQGGLGGWIVNDCTQTTCLSPTPTPTTSTSLTPTPTLFKTLTPTKTKTPTLTKTPTPTPSPTFQINCLGAKIYNKDWEEITDYAKIPIGTSVYIAVFGETDEPFGLTKGRIKINSGDWVETGSKRPENENEFYTEHTIENYGNYTIEGQVFNPIMGWK